MGILTDAGAWLREQMQATAGVSVSYARVAGGSAIALTAWVGRSGASLITEGNTRRTQWGERDYLIAADELLVSAARVQPTIGDRITETIQGASCVFEITQPATGEPGWRWADGQSREMYRLHVKRVS